MNIEKQKAIAAIISSLQNPLNSLVDGCVKFRETFGDEEPLLSVDGLDFFRNNETEAINETETSFINFDLAHNKKCDDINKKQANYFSWNNINEMTDVDSHIGYASTLMNKYRWESRTKYVLEQQLKRIINKQNDKLLNICVIGEFSTGKSSFINALVNYELLAVNSIQGTTVAITVIEYGEEYGITITDFKGNISREKYLDIEALRKVLYFYTTDEKYKDKICFLTVTLPSDILRNGFRIIDTPGTNSLELWHEAITQRAITELSDLSIVLVDATKPMPETLNSFVESALGSSIKDCAFVVNKIDLVREKERSSIVKYISVKVEHTFGIEKPLVLPFSSVSLTNMFSQDKYSVDNDSFLLTTDSLKQLLAYTARNRVKAQARKVLQFIDQIYTTLNKEILLVAEKYEKSLSLLEHSQQTDLKPFIQKQNTARIKHFVEEARNCRFNIDKKSDILVKSAISTIYKKIDDFSSLDNLSDFIKKGRLSDYIKKEGCKMSNSLETQFSGAEGLFSSEIQLFQSEFKIEFRRLQMLSVQLEVTPRKIDVRRISHSANIEPVSMLISDELSKENWALGGGAVAGAAVGTFILPGIGSVIGAVIGSIVGSSASPDIADVKESVKSKLSIPLSSYYRSVANDCLSNYDTYINDLCKNLEMEINRYYTKYNTVIQHRIKEWKEQYCSVKTNMQNIQSEIDRIQSRQHSIKTIISRI